MKKLHFLLWLVLFLSVSVVWGDESISLLQGETKTIQLPFVLNTYRILPTDSKMVRVEEMDSSHLRVIGGSVGEVSLVVNGLTGEQRVYSVVVKSNLTATLRKIRKDLENLTELDISINEDRIVINGTVSNPDHWSHLQRVLPLYSKDCVCFATFAISADTVLDLKKRLQDAGFSFAESRETQKPGELLLTSNKDTIFLSGELFNKKAIDDVNRVLDTAPIMIDGLVKKALNLTTAEKILDISVAFVSLSDSDNFTRTGNINPIGTFDASFLRRWLDGREAVKTIGIGSSMNGTLSMLQSNLVAKVLEQGSMSFPNGGSGTSNFGGTIKVPVSGIDSGDLKDVTFGYNVTISGELTSEKKVKLNMNLRQQDVVTDEKGNYVQKENSVTLDLPLELDKTHIVSHHKKLTEMSSESGFPVLGKIPVIKWFFSDSGDRKEVVNVLVLVSASVRTKTSEYTIELDPQESIDKIDKDTHEILDDSMSVGDDLEKIFR